MGCGASSRYVVKGERYKGPMVRTIPKEYGEKDFRCKEKKEVPAMGTRVGWYNLKEDQLVVTKATAFPTGNDKYSDHRQMDPEDIKKMDELVVGAVVADENGNRYVNVLELAAARKDEQVYVIKGRIEKSSWRDKDDSWVTILGIQCGGSPALQNMWEDDHPDNWTAEPVEADVAQAKPVKPPTQSFEDWRKADKEKLDAKNAKKDEEYAERMYRRWVGEYTVMVYKEEPFASKAIEELKRMKFKKSIHRDEFTFSAGSCSFKRIKESIRVVVTTPLKIKELLWQEYPIFPCDGNIPEHPINVGDYFELIHETEINSEEKIKEVFNCQPGPEGDELTFKDASICVGGKLIFMTPPVHTVISQVGA